MARQEGNGRKVAKMTQGIYRIYKISKPREMLSDVKINLTVDSANKRYDVK